jgi:hypothetical protein
MTGEEVVMAKVRRNGPCPCGSGNKAKYCCLKERSSAAESPTRLLPLEVCRDAALDLEGVSNAEIHALFDEMIYLPETDISLQVPLPRLVTPEIDRAISALDEDDGEAFDRELNEVVPTVDTPQRRIDLADAVITLRDQGRISSKLAAVALFDLDGETSALFISSVAESIAVLGGDQQTPTGLLVAAQ